MLLASSAGVLTVRCRVFRSLLSSSLCDHYGVLLVFLCCSASSSSCFTVLCFLCWEAARKQRERRCTMTGPNRKSRTRTSWSTCLSRSSCKALSPSKILKKMFLRNTRSARQSTQHPSLQHSCVSCLVQPSFFVSFAWMQSHLVLKEHPASNSLNSATISFLLSTRCRPHLYHAILQRWSGWVVERGGGPPART